MSNQKPEEVINSRFKAVGNLSFLMSCIRCGEQLSDQEESIILGLIAELKADYTKEIDTEFRLSEAILLLNDPDLRECTNPELWTDLLLHKDFSVTCRESIPDDPVSWCVACRAMEFLEGKK